MENIKIFLCKEENLEAVKYFIESNIISDDDINCDSMRDHIYENIADRTSKTVIAAHNDKVIGLVSAKKFNNKLQHEIFPDLNKNFYNAYELCNGYIHKDFRRKGMFHKLINTLEKEFPTAEAFSAAIMVTNPSSIEFFKKEGYKFISDGSLDWFYDNKVRKLVLFMKIIREDS